MIRETNAELEATEPWKSDPGPAVDAVLGSALEALRIVALLALPAMPDTSAEIWRRLGLDRSHRPSVGCPRTRPGAAIPGGLTVERGAPRCSRDANE